ncbi:MAG TPA: hypothetical protein VMV55_00225 [Methanoregula sp.]|nr:hypothetical protein [Methanoregula sp.]
MIEEYRLSCNHHKVCKWMCTALKCPYHTPAKSEQSIRQENRDGEIQIVLDALKERIKSVGFEAKDEAAFLYLVEYVETHLDEVFYLAELRSKQGEQQ